MAFPLLAFLAGLALAEPAAAASSVEYSKSGSASCNFLGVTTCTMIWSHSVSSHISDCAGSQGSFTSCQVHHFCNNSGNGEGYSGRLNCDWLGSQNCGGALSLGCTNTLSGTVPVNGCLRFSMSANGASLLGNDAHADDNPGFVCVNQDGPYLSA